ncbi:MAG: hypothetical protein IPH45_19025 [Bacteroidales bacterium]|nr:hypothetical protein [Bacteroidales bacterium]
MKHLLLPGIVLVLSSIASAQISGPKTIPGNYSTIQAAIAALNTQGVGSGGVTFVVALNHTETLANATAGVLTATGTATDSIIFKKASEPGQSEDHSLHPGTSASADGIIKISGGDFIVFDGIDLAENAIIIHEYKTEWGMHW